MHFRRLTANYFEHYSAAEITRHLRLLASLERVHSVELDMRPFAAQAFEVVVVGMDYPGTLACITAALAAYGFDLEDVQVSPYLESGAGPTALAEPKYFVIVLRVSGAFPGRSLFDFVAEMRDRLRIAFGHLAQGNLLDAQTVAAGTRTASAEASASSLNGNTTSVRPAGYEGLLLGNDFRLDRKLAT